MARRALVFRAGSVGLICAAYEVEIIPGTVERPGSMRPVRACPNPATELLEGADGCQTGLCADCRNAVATSPSVGVAKIQRPRNN